MKKILIVEDSAIIAMHLKILLEESGYTVVGRSTNAEDAIRMTRELCPDLILMDVMLEGLASGIEATSEIRKFCQSPVIFMSALTDGKSVNEMTSFSNAYLASKPFSETELLSLVKTYLTSVNKVF